MPAVPRSTGGRARDERGFSLIELLVVVASMLVLLVAGYGVLKVTVRSEPRISERAASVQQARVLMERISRELRQGYGIGTAQPSQLTIGTYVRRTSCGGAAGSSSIPCQVTYTCASGSCTRTERNPDGSGGGPGVQLVAGLGDSNVFEYLPSAADPDYVGLSFSFPAREGDDAVTLGDGAALRNAGVPPS